MTGVAIDELKLKWEEAAKTMTDSAAKMVEHDQRYGSAIEAINGKLVKVMDKVDNYGRINRTNYILDKKNPINCWSSKESAERFVELFKAMHSADGVALKAMTEGTNSAGGFTVHPEFTTTIMRLISIFGWARQWATIIPMNALTTNQSTLTAGVSVFWINEEGTITQSQPTFGRVVLTAKKMAVLIPVSSELDADSTLNLANFLATIVGESMAQEEDRVVLMGDISGAGDPFNGIGFAPGVVDFTLPAGSTTFDDFHPDDAQDATQEVIQAARDGARWVMDSSVESVLAQAKESTAGGYLYGNPREALPGQLWGKPVDHNEVMSSVNEGEADSDTGTGTMAIYGNPKWVLLGDRQTMTISRSDHFLFDTDMIAWKFTRRVAVTLAIPSAFVRIKPSLV